MSYLDFDHLHSLDPAAFQSQHPYPWINPEALLTEEGYQELLETLPHSSLFTPIFDKQRAHGQRSHDRYGLAYRPHIPLAAPWREFIAELSGPDYRQFLHQMLGTRFFDVGFHWHYTPNGCSVSPHCDAKYKLGSHIFYFNTDQDWDPAWGGETVILDDAGRFNRESAPQFEDFEQAIPSQSLGNRSLLFARRKNSWHGVREMRCPEDRMRKVFIVVINRHTPLDRVKQFFGGKAKGYE